MFGSPQTLYAPPTLLCVLLLYISPLSARDIT